MSQDHASSAAADDRDDDVPTDVEPPGDVVDLDEDIEVDCSDEQSSPATNDPTERVWVRV